MTGVLQPRMEPYRQRQQRHSVGYYLLAWWRRGICDPGGRLIKSCWDLWPIGHSNRATQKDEV